MAENGGAITLGQHVVRRGALGDAVVLEKYDVPGAERPDHHVETDLAKCREVYNILRDKYPGYTQFWAVIYDSTHGYCFIMLPVLMGVADGFFINLKTHEANERTVTNAGGVILELYQQSRTRFNINDFLTARQKHSKLVIPSRRVPT